MLSTRVVPGLERRQDAELSLVELMEQAAHRRGWLRRYVRGEALYCQGSPADSVFVVKRGKVRTLCVSTEGKTLTLEILGAGRLAGLTACVLDGVHQSTAEALEDTDAYSLPTAELERILASHPGAALAVLHELAQTARSLACKVQDITFLDVQNRLKHSLVRLATEYGLETDRGVKIDLDITHEGIAELIAANRSTTTTCINRLIEEGTVWKEGRRLVILPPRQIEILDSLSRAVMEGDDSGAVCWARKAAEEQVDPRKALEALTGGMKRVDERFNREEAALPDVVMSAFAMKRAMPLVEEEMRRAGQERPVVGTVVIGTVEGDIHDIGKTLVAMFLVANGFRVIDLGVNVPPGLFLEAIRQYQPDILAMSALMTMTVPEQMKVVRLLEEEALRSRVRIIVGGGAIGQAQALKIGADGYEPTAQGAVELARRLCGRTKVA